MSAPRLGDLSALKLALMAKKVRADAREVLRADPIAIVGVGCRVPGGGDSPQRFWELLCAGTDAIGEVPRDRWDGDAWFDADPSAPAKSLTKSGGFLDAIDGFDAGYFGIVPREAERMDPQQRLLLEVAMEALDDAGIPRERLAGSRASVYVASYHNDYAQLQHEDLEAVDARTLTGTLHSVLTNRLSYFLDLRGPSVSIDTACSSSLVATHLACQSLREGESDVAIAGGVSLMITPHMMVSLSKVGFMAPDGRSKTFDARADGFGRGEGCGVIVLKRLSDAIADGDRIHAVVRGSTVNSDGHSTVLAAPNGLAQKAMLLEALANAQMAPHRIGFVETHGTGTALGDPIEVEAIAATIGQPRDQAGTCYLGAAKANLGHLEAAAGIVGLIKTVLALQNEAIPPQVHFSKLSPHISLAGTRLAIPTALMPWPRGPVTRCAGVSGFGVGGTNAHVVLEEAPRLPSAAAATSDVPRVLALSAQSPEALRALAERWIRFLPETAASVVDLCYTAAERRTHHELRLAVVGRTKEGLAAELAAHLADATSSTASPVAFVFSGQGPQWHAMGRELFAGEAVFRDVITQCDALLRPLAGWSLVEELARTEAESRLAETRIAQPALFALQIALAALWRSWGVVPAAVVGHSVGEIAALHVAGVLTLGEAIRIVHHRGLIMHRATGLGRMAQVALTPEEAAAEIASFGERLSVGAVNGPRNVVLSGETAALEAVLASLTARGVAHRMLPVEYAFHSAQMAPFQIELKAALGDVAQSQAALPVYSTVTGALATGVSFDAAYFGRNVREPVRFANAIRALADDGFATFVEIGPHPVLAGAITESVEATGRSMQVLASLRRTQPERETMLRACARLYETGITPAWRAFQQADGQLASLPAYPWQRQRYWIRRRPTATSHAPADHPILGRRIDVAGDRIRLFEATSDGAPAWLADHRIFDRLPLPATVILDAFAAAACALGSASRIKSFALDRPLFLPEETSDVAKWQIVATATGESSASLELFDWDGAWRKSASAAAEVAAETPAAAVRETCGPDAESIDADAFYRRFAELGVAFGPAFRRLTNIRRDPRGVAEAWVELPPGLDERRGSVHPVLLDAALQLCSIAAPRGPGGELPREVLLPVGVDRFDGATGAHARLFVRAQVRETAGTLTADITLDTPDGQRACTIRGVRFARADASAFAAPADDLVYDVVWQREKPTRATSVAGTWLVFADRGGAGDALAKELGAAGARCARVYAGTEFTRKSPDTWTIDPASAEHVRRLFAEGGWSTAAPLRGAVHLWNLDLATFGDGGAGEDVLGTGSLLHLTQSLVGVAAMPCTLVVVTRGAQVTGAHEPASSLRPRAAAAWGLAGVIALEHSELEIRRVDLDPREVSPAATGLFAEVALAAETTTSVALRGHERWTERLARRKDRSESDPLRLDLVHPGTLDGIELRPYRRGAIGPDDVRLRVLASGINFRDVLLTLGAYTAAGIPLGAECVGIVIEAGKNVRDFALGARVFGFAPGSLATEVTVPAAFLAPVPAAMSTEDAAGIPVAFLTAYYGLHTLAELKAGERVLIHAAAGGVGLAAVQIAKACGAEIFATAGSEDKRALLRSLGVAHVMDSRSLAFADEIHALTKGQGVHVVLNSLAGDFIPASLRALGPGGRFLELGKRDIMTRESAAKLRPDVRYDAYDLGSEAEADRALLRPLFDRILAGLEAGQLRPLPVTVHALEETADAFRFIAQAKHIGKVVVRPRSVASTGPIVRGDATYLVTGGLGALGLETARWLVRSGARSIALTGRHAPNARALETIRELERDGAAVRVFEADVADRSAMEHVFAAIDQALPPLRGVIHSAGVVRDSLIAHQTWEQCRDVLRGKADGAWVLHELTRDRQLDLFILYSAAGVVLGASGQGAYPAANARLDALARTLRAAGLPALSVAWGPWAGAGMAADLAAKGRDVWSERGLGKLSATDAFTALERSIRAGIAYAAIIPIRWQVFLEHLSPRADRAFFDTVAPRRSESVGGGIVERLRTTPAGQRRDALAAHLTERARQVLAFDASKAVDPKVPLKEVGLDSLMAVELRNLLMRSIGRPLPGTLLFDYPTIDALSGFFVRTLDLEERAAEPTRASEAAGQEPGSFEREIAELSDEAAEALLLQELEQEAEVRK